ncbi:MAG TPA: tetratricopeptide repeat protein [Candidatus Marinimicrobia bacterium]|nr:tetratricopeptide repeat protein [Candidatus Neomarinimicrobiota bacterium]
MRQNKKRLFIFGVSLFLGIVFLSNCVPQDQRSPEELAAIQRAKRDSLRKANYNRCLFKMSNADQYKIQENWTVAIQNYKEVLELGCVEDFADPLFKDLAHCYFRLNKTDSASWAIDEGLIYNPTNLHMLQLLAYYNRGNVEKSIEAWNRIVTLYPGNTDYMFELADLYFNSGRYDDQITLLEQILEIDPENRKAELSIIAAYEAKGIDPVQLYAKNFELDKTNPQYAYQYAKRLVDTGDYRTAITVLEESLKFNLTNRNLADLLAKSYENTGQMDLAVKTYEELSKRNPSDNELLIKISGLYREMGQYRTALGFAEKAVSLPPHNGRALAERGEVYLSIAQANTMTLNLSDKLVYHMAYEDFKNALAQGNGTVRSKINFLERNELIIMGQRDYFLATDANKVGPNEYKPIGEGYNWITRTIKIQ